MISLIPVTEAAERHGKSPKTIKRLCKAHGIHTEHQVVKGSGNASRVLMVDPNQLELALASSRLEQLDSEQLDTPKSHGATGQGACPVAQATGHRPENAPLDGQNPDELEQLDTGATGHSPDSPAMKLSASLVSAQNVGSNLTIHTNPSDIPAANLIIARQRAGWVAPLAAELARLPYGGRGPRLERAAQEHGLSPRQVKRLLADWERGGLLALATKPRKDKGKGRLPEPLLRTVVGVVVTNPGRSPKWVRRILELNDPALLRYHPYPNSPRTATLSVAAISNVIARLKQDPAFRFALMDEKQQREFARVWVGEVMAAHANQLWMGDMTRCDCVVLDPYTGKPVRLRIHATIDVFSGAVPGFVFSRSEAQDSTDRMMMLSLLPKKMGDWEQRWPVWGQPERLYWDNGKTYRSTKSHQTLTDLGVEIIHSKPRVSHSRGNIERFFGVFHGWEAGLPGYAGSDTKERDHIAIARLMVNTQRWLAGEIADPYPDRLLTEDEYKFKALLWLTLDYHKQIVRDGKTREELFLSTAPASTRPLYTLADLQVAFAKRERRTVRGNGTVTIGSRVWGLPDAALVAYQGMAVVVLTSDLLPDARPLVAAEQPGGLKILGTLEPMDWRADGSEAIAWRKAAKRQIADIQAAARALREQYLDPELRHDAVLERIAGEPAPAPRPLTLSAPAPTAAPLVTDPDDLLRQQALDAEAAFLAEGFDLYAPIALPEQGPNTLTASETQGEERGG